MRVTFNTTFAQSRADLARTAEQLTESQLQVSSGRRVNVPSDDPTAAAGAVHEYAEMGTLDQYSRASDTASSRLSVVDSALGDIINQITAAQSTLATARGSTVTADQRDAAATTLKGIRDALQADLNTQFNGTYVFSGAAATTEPYATQADGSVSAYQGSTSTTSVDVDRTTSVQITFDGQSIAQGSDSQDLFTALDQMIAAVKSGDDTGMAAGATTLSSAFTRATAAQTQTGILENGLTAGSTRLSDLRRAADARRSKYEDADLVDAITKMNQADTAYRAALGAVGSVGQQTLMDYIK